LTKKLQFNVAAVSAAAKDKIEKAGGALTLNPPRDKARPKKGKKNG
jgi:ribosomal protein L18E